MREWMHMPKVFVVDDDSDMRQSLGGLIELLGYEVEAFPSAAAFRRRYQPQRPNCLVLDIQMPRQSGLELYEELIRDGIRIPVIFITAHADISTAVAAMKTGAIEFLEKPFQRSDLETNIAKALELDDRWAQRDEEFTAIESGMSQLSDRELETLQLVLAGDSNKVIAGKLFVSERAVEMRRASIMRKLNVRSTSELINAAITHRLLAELREAMQHSHFDVD